MTKISENHFFKQFDRYVEGQQRFEAVAKHAAMLLQAIEERKDKEIEILTLIRDMLARGENPVLIALMIQERLESEFDDRGDSLPIFPASEPE